MRPDELIIDDFTFDPRPQVEGESLWCSHCGRHSPHGVRLNLYYRTGVQDIICTRCSWARL